MLNELLKETDPFLDKIFEFTRELNLDVDKLVIDHISLRYKDAKNVDLLSQELNKVGNCISNEIINGRYILVYKLNNPIRYRDKNIKIVELPYPAPDHSFPYDGWEHVEFILPCSNKDSFEKYFREYSKVLTENELVKYGYKFSSPHFKTDTIKNPTCALTKYKGLTIKFSPISIEEVILTRREL